MTTRQKSKGGPSRSRGAWASSDAAMEALGECELFRDVGRSRLMAVAALAEEYQIEPDEMLLTEGDNARHIFVVIEGQGIAQLKLERGWQSLGLVGPGAVAGWASLTGRRVYPASVRALTLMKVVRVDVDGLSSLMNLEPDIGYAIQKSMSSILYGQYELALSVIRASV